MGKRLVGRSQGSGRRVLGDAAWEGLPKPTKQIFRQRPGDRCRVFHGGLLDVSLELGTIVRPTFLVTARDSPPAFAEATDLLAQAMPSAMVECIEGVTSSIPHIRPFWPFVDEVLAEAVLPSALGPNATVVEASETRLRSSARFLCTKAWLLSVRAGGDLGRSTTWFIEDRELEMAKPLYKVLEVDSTLQAFCKHPGSAAMSPYSA